MGTEHGLGATRGIRKFAPILGCTRLKSTGFKFSDEEIGWKDYETGQD